MRIYTKTIRDGCHIGEIVWICHYNRPDLHKKALRNVPPTKVMVMDNAILPKNKTVYYSDTHFAPIGKSGEPTKKVISPVDNTGFRSRCGNELFVFTTEEECIKEWNDQLEEHCGRLDVIIANAAKYWKDDKATLLAAMK
jgi:hypothetical protein